MCTKKISLCFAERLPYGSHITDPNVSNDVDDVRPSNRQHRRARLVSYADGMTGRCVMLMAIDEAGYQVDEEAPPEDLVNKMLSDRDV